ncbi:GDSL esterase/lipase At5g62930 [Dendrobium catenatum]|uniref:GDSL esterase/lipase n=1 Tax=Dendrobium catenatum TaxID=906689 RepID=A0A2I0W766_9ASPA|nr:GDSL esterase/lipase At5g62930 [Dendrobium catenatum]PKU71505.1 GDSL esterase/lipase [Dendrobium catenatum]
MIALGANPSLYHQIQIKKLGFFFAVIFSYKYFRLAERETGGRTSKLKMDLIRSRFVLFGDSITEQSFRPGGWGAALANTYARKADIIVRGYGGYNTRWALFLLNRIFPLNFPGAPAVTTVFFGANDAVILGRTSEKQHVPTEEYKQNLRKIVHHLKDCSPTMLVILITPPPVDENGRNEYARLLYGDKARKLPERTNEMTGVYANKCIELAQELNLPYIDLWSHMQETADWQKKFLSDGLHLTPEGNAVVHEEVVRVLYNAGLRAEDLPYDFPHHSQIDGQDFAKAFKPMN